MVARQMLGAEVVVRVMKGAIDVAQVNAGC